MQSPNEQVEFLNNNIKVLFDSHLPKKRRKVNSGSKPWFNRNIRYLIELRDRAYYRWKRFRIEELYAMYKSYRNKVVNEIKAVKTRYFSNRLQINSNGRTLWKNLRDLGIGKTKPKDCCNLNGNDLNSRFLDIGSTSISTDHNSVNITNIFHGSNLSNPHPSSQFCFSFSGVNNLDVVEAVISVKSNANGVDGIHPVFIKAILPTILPFITHVFNSILKTGIFPCQWKLAKIIPLPKNSGGTEFRPISILPYLSKVFERLLQKQINDYLNRNNLLTNLQSGFRAKHSCITAVLKVTDDIRIGLDNDDLWFLILLDFSKAFDNVDHNILCNKLRNFFFNYYM